MRKDSLTITVYRTLMLCGLLLGCVCAAAAYGDSVPVVVKGRMLVAAEGATLCPNFACCEGGVYCAGKVMAPNRRGVFVPVRVARPCVTEVTVERRSPGYKIVETAPTPYIRHGIFGIGIACDRVIVPRRSTLSVEKW